MHHCSGPATEVDAAAATEYQEGMPIKNGLHKAQRQVAEGEWSD